jgi:hypothetical protein
LNYRGVFYVKVGGNFQLREVEGEFLGNLRNSERERKINGLRGKRKQTTAAQGRRTDGKETVRVHGTCVLPEFGLGFRFFFWIKGQN